MASSAHSTIGEVDIESRCERVGRERMGGFICSFQPVADEAAASGCRVVQSCSGRHVISVLSRPLEHVLVAKQRGGCGRTNQQAMAGPLTAGRVAGAARLN